MSDKHPGASEGGTAESSSITNTDMRQVRIAGSCLLAGGLIFMLFNTIAEGIYPNYVVGTRALSNLGALGSNTAVLWDGQLLVVSLLLLSGTYLLFFRSQFRVGLAKAKWVGVLFMLPGVGAMLVSLFPGNSGLGSLHFIGAFIAFIFGGVSAVYAFRLTGAPFRYFSVVLGVTALVAVSVTLWELVYFIGSQAPISGLVERLVVYPYVLWGVSFGSYLLAVPAERR